MQMRPTAMRMPILNKALLSLVLMVAYISHGHYSLKEGYKEAIWSPYLGATLLYVTSSAVAHMTCLRRRAARACVNSCSAGHRFTCGAPESVRVLMLLFGRETVLVFMMLYLSSCICTYTHHSYMYAYIYIYIHVNV